jgi:CheY-like chemotaxis protein
MNASPLVDPLPKILIADSEVDSDSFYAHVLGLSESEVVHAMDGRDALVKVLEHPFALVITETRLPYVDGYGLCEVIRHDPDTRNIPIIVVTADSRPASLKRALLAGADVALAKPCVADALLAEARRLLVRSKELRERSDNARLKLAAQRDKSKALLSSSGRPMRGMDAHHRYDTTQPPIVPPPLRCSTCDQPLVYEFSHVGGVSAREPEQWDYYTCANSCGRFQYRQRTRRVRRV